MNFVEISPNLKPVYSQFFLSSQKISQINKYLKPEFSSQFYTKSTQINYKLPNLATNHNKFLSWTNLETY